MQKIKQFVIRNLKFVIIFLVLVLPAISFAQSGWKGLVPTCPATGCGFPELMSMINTVINFIFKSLAVPIAAIMFAYAGILMVTSGGSGESRTKAKSIFTNAAIGLILAAASWLIIKTILIIMGYNDIDTFFN